LVEALKKAVQLSGERQKKKNRTRISQETIHLMAKRAQMKADGVTDAEYVTLCKTIRQKLKQDYDEYRKKRLREAAEKKSSLKTVERDIRLKQHIPVALKNDIGERTTDRDRMNDICKNFYNGLYSSKVSVPRKQPCTEFEEIPSIMWEEVEKAICKSPKGKCPGKDGIKVDYLRVGGATVAKALAERFTPYVRQRKTPIQWKISTTILLMKKGDTENFRSYGQSPSCHRSKKFSHE
ncbi:hypothetical protein AB6A40_011618, partial [Gnathostoma spinigerum]